MVSDDGKYFGLTAGHVLPDGDRKLVVKTDDDELATSLEVAEMSLRIQGRPRGRMEDGSELGFEDEVVLLKINDQNSHKFKEFLYCPNCHHFGLEASKERAADPLAYLRSWPLLKHITGKQLKVYKSGATTGRTSRCLVDIHFKSPPGWNGKAVLESVRGSDRVADRVADPAVFDKDEPQEDEPQEEEEEDDDDEDGDEQDEESNWESDGGSGGNENDISHHDSKCGWLGIVEWDKEVAFSAGGDSGSMAYAMDKQIMILLGVYLGTPWPNRRSIFLCLEAYCREANKEG